MKQILKILAWPVTLALSALVWLCTAVLSCAAFLFGLASALITILALAVLLAGSAMNAAILAGIAFLVSPLGLPMLAARMLGGVASVNEAIKNFIYG